MVTVRDILGLNVMRSASVLAGEKGLGRYVSRVGFSDMPLESTSHSPFLAERDLLIRSFYPTAKTEDHEQEIVDTVSLYIKSKCAGCVVFRRFLLAFPQRALDLADANDFPIIALNEVTSYAKLIQEISNQLLLSQQQQYQEKVLLRLMYEPLPTAETAALCRQLITFPQEQFVIICISSKEHAYQNDRFYQSLVATPHAVLFRCSNTEFIVFPFDHAPAGDTHLEYLLSRLGAVCHIGVSCLCSREEFPTALRQAFHGVYIAMAQEQSVFYYNNASSHALLMSLIDSEKRESIANYCKEILDPLRQYEQEEKIDLIRTLDAYIQFDGNISQVAKCLYLHENTARARISKAKSLLGLSERHFEFIQRVSLALEAEALMKTPPRI